MASTRRPGRDWRTMSPAHFDSSKLPAKHRDAPEGLFPVADVALPVARPTVPAAELDGQQDLLSLLAEPGE
jgi:hypothetical protein